MAANAKSRGQGIDHGQVRKTAEVAVCRPQLTDPVLTAKRRDARIMDPRPDDFARADHRPQMRPVLVGFRQQEQSRGSEPHIHLLDRACDRCRRIENTRMRDYAEKLMNARPRNGPRVAPFRKIVQPAFRDMVKRRFRPMCVDEDIGIDRNHSLGYP